MELAHTAGRIHLVADRPAAVGQELRVRGPSGAIHHYSAGAAAVAGPEIEDRTEPVRGPRLGGQRGPAPKLAEAALPRPVDLARGRVRRPQ